MTLVAAWKTKTGTPVLVGDLLIVSSDESDAQHIQNFPTTDDLDVILPRDWSIRVVGMAQKAYVIARNLAVGMAGPVRIGACVLNEMYSQFSEGEPSFGDVAAFLREHGARKEFQFALCGWIVESTGPVCFEWRSDRPGDIKRVSRAAIGSGKPILEEVFAPVLEWGSFGAEGEAVQIAAELMGREVVHGEPLRLKFGGGTKVIVWNQGEFRVVPSIQYSFLQMQERAAEIQWIQIPRLLRVSYEGGLIVIVTTTFDNSLDKDHVTVITPLVGPFRTKLEVDTAIPCVYYCIFCSLRRLDGSTELFTFTVAHGNHEPWFHLNGGQMEIQNTMLEPIMKRVRSSRGWT